MGNADKDLLVFVLRHGETVIEALTEFAEKYASTSARDAARDAAWLLKVNRPDWSHGDVHTDDCLDDWSERGRANMTPATVEANHRLHMGHVERIESAFRAQR